MIIVYTEKFLVNYERADTRIQAAMDKQVILLGKNIRHPSLHAKKYDEANDIWQARVTKGWRFYFSIKGDTYYLHSLKNHPK